MISEESRDTEDWSNDAENSALHHRNTLYFKQKTIIWNCNTGNTVWYYCLVLYFWSNKLRLGEQKICTAWKHKK